MHKNTHFFSFSSKWHGKGSESNIVPLRGYVKLRFNDAMFLLADLFIAAEYITIIK
jgi:hypothetical protein